jgi:hypothetical protein
MDRSEEKGYLFETRPDTDTESFRIIIVKGDNGRKKTASWLNLFYNYSH